MRSNIIYRPYTPSDQTAVKELLKELVREIAKLNPNRLPEPLPEYAGTYLAQIEKHIEKNEGVMILAEADGQLIGYGIGHLREEAETDHLEFHPTRTGYIPDVFVLNTYRNQGIGKEIIIRIEQYFRGQHYDFVELSVLVKNSLAHDLYIKLGYQDFLIEMQKRL
jgi:ribosomal protein S18 acetylase RimI-like enzyme